MPIKSAEQDQRRSFSFSSFDFNSSNNSASLFSSSEDGFFASNFAMYDTEDDDDDGAYIEINLNPRPAQKTELVEDKDGIKRNFHIEEKECNTSPSEVELRLSFSSEGIPQIETTTCGTTQQAQGTTMNKPNGRLFALLARIVNEFIAASSAKTSNSFRAIEAKNVACEHGRAHLPPVSKSDCTEMIRCRKGCRMVASKSIGIMNFIVKFKYTNIPSKLVSIVTPKSKTEQMHARQPLLQRGSSTCRCTDAVNNENMNLRTRSRSDLNRDKLASSSVTGIRNFKTMRGLIKTLIVRTCSYYTSAGTRALSTNKQNKSKSCPSSINSSPMHSNVCDDEVRRFYSRDNSVQAAIAHCKKSYGSQAEFDFHL
ncbi:unnamed protein product [Withania somnifera]